MFNFCVLSGPVLSEPRFFFNESQPEAIFELGVSLGLYQVGYIKVSCHRDVAAVAVDSIHKGDRVAVVGIIGRYVYEGAKEEEPPPLVMVALDLELIRRDSPTLGFK